jgi:LruC domain-containing protein
LAYTLSGVQNKTINDGHTYYITGSASGFIDVKHGTLQICGGYSGTLNMGDNSDESNVIISSTGTANLSSISKDDHSTLDNYGTLSITGNFTPKAQVRNFGTMTVSGSYLMNSGGPHNPELINSGMLTIGNEFNVHEQLTNNGTIEVIGHMNCNNSHIFNGCKIIVHLDFHLNNAEFTNQSGYLKVYQETFIQGGQSFMKLIDQSMISTYDLTMNADITGSTTNATKNEVKVSHDLRFDGPNVVKGPVEVAQTNGVLANGSASNFTNGATFVSFANILNTILTSECNPEGVTPTPPPPPPLTNNITTGTLVFEDLWPSMGDYDMNDLVVYYKYNLQTNAQNKVVDIIAKFYVKAAGAGLRNGFGFQINALTPAQIGSVTGASLNHSYVSLNANGTEAGQGKAVVVAWDNTDDVINRVAPSSFFNTLPGTGVGTADTVTITIHLTTPLLTTAVGTAPFNPFLIKGMERGVEVHLPDYVPTSLADQSYFGTSDDNSNSGLGRYYKTSSSLPWALNIPVAFDYPFEYIDITQAYIHFAAWAQSGGTSYPNWYANIAGYRDLTKIWQP